MKTVNTSSLAAITLAFIITLNFSCQKEVKHDPSLPEEATAANGNGPNDPGFVENDMVMFWNEKADIVYGAGFTQPPRTRVFARIQVAVHNALNAIKPKYERYHFNEREQHADPDAAVASAAYHVIKGTILPPNNYPVDAWYDSCLATIPDGASKDSGIVIGKKAATAMLANRANDGFSQNVPNSLTPPNGVNPGEYRSTLTAVNWVPTSTIFTFRLSPLWGTVMRPWVIESNQQFRPGGPYPVISNEYTTDFNEVKTKGARVGGIRTAEEEKISMFWSESNSSLIWNLFVRKAIQNKKLDAWKTARLFALMHVSMAETNNSYFNAGYHYYFWRPETAVRLAANDGNNNTEGNPNWLPFLSDRPTFVTQPLPGYPNSSAAFGGTTAEILRLFFATDATSINITTTSTNPTVTVPKPSFHYSSFSQATRDNSLSMIYSGWDFRKSVTDGEEMGKRIANYIFTHAFREE